MIYSPQEDSYLLQKIVKQKAKNKSVLDMGTGSGILAETALQSKAKFVLATDINPEAIKLLKSKFKNREDIQIIKSNIFLKIPRTTKFDLIVFNPPYLPLDEREPINSRRETTGGRFGDEISLRFLEKSISHLNKKGVILLLVSSLTPMNRIKELLKTLNLAFKIIARKKLFMESLFVLEIKKTTDLKTLYNFPQHGS